MLIVYGTTEGHTRHLTEVMVTVLTEAVTMPKQRRRRTIRAS
ncbi:MAG: hypothetical protein ABW128_12205 [Rhizorhabdus sp.]